MKLSKVVYFLPIMVLSLFLLCCEKNETKDVGTTDDADAGVSDALTLDASESDISTTPNNTNYLNKDFIEGIAEYLASDELAGRDEGTPGSRKAREFLIDQLKRCNVKPKGEDGFEQKITTGEGTNILGYIEGGDLKERFVLISAHYDHLGKDDRGIFNGAGDNAVAAGMVMAVACELAKTTPKKSLLVAFWDSEEPLTFMTDEMGSEFFAENPTLELNKIDLAIVLDLVGLELWPGYQNHFVFGAELSVEIADMMKDLDIPAGLIFKRPSYHLIEELVSGDVIKWSDYHAFISRGVPAMFFSDGTNQHYHQPTDTMETVNLDKAEKELQYLFNFTNKISNLDVRPGFDLNGSDLPLDVKLVSEILEDALADGGIIDGLELSSWARSRISSDKEKVDLLLEIVSDGGELNNQQIIELRTATQRLMCYCNPQYSVGMCHLM